MALWMVLVALATAGPRAATSLDPADGGTAPADVVHLRFDLAGGSLEVAAGDLRQEFALPQRHLAPRLDGFRQALARGTWDPEEAAALGEILLAPAQDLLDSARTWEVTPLEASPLSAMIAPWTNGEVLLESVVTWYRPAGQRSWDTPDPSGGRGDEPPASRPADPGEGMLAVLPFHAGWAPATDSPDTVLVPLRRDLHTLDLVPRNDTTAPAIAGSLLDRRYAVLWLRATPDVAQPLLAVLSGGPPLLWWTRPGREMPGASSIGAALDLAVTWSSGGKTLCLDLWPRSEARVAEGLRGLLPPLRANRTVGQSMAEARRRLRSRGAPPLDWAGWILVGDGCEKANLREPSWLQRILRP